MKNKIISVLFALALLFTLTVPAFAAQNIEDVFSGDLFSLEQGSYYFIDDADLVYSEENEAEIEKYLSEISSKHNFDVVIVTVSTLDGKSPMAYADDYFDYNGYGQGENRDGCLLLVSMEDRDWWISTSGYGIEALTDAGISYIGGELTPFLSSGDYYNAFVRFGSLTDEFISQADSGSPFDIGTLPKPEKKFDIKYLITGLIAGFIIALIVTNRLKSKLKTVSQKSAATDYLVPGSFVLTQKYDTFINENVTRVKIDKEKSSGGSSTHTSSSGSTHGGGGGKF